MIEEVESAHRAVVAESRQGIGHSAPSRGPLVYVRIVASVMVMACLLTVTGSPQPAAAICHGNITGWGGSPYEFEMARYSSTCDGDRYYTGKAADAPIPDRAALQVQYKIGGGSYYTQFWTGNTYYRNYSFQYHGSSTVRVRLYSSTSGAHPTTYTTYGY